MGKNNQKISLLHSVRNFTLKIVIIMTAGISLVGIFDKIFEIKTFTNYIYNNNLSNKSAIIKDKVENTCRLISQEITNNHTRVEVLNDLKKIYPNKNNDDYIFIISYDGTILFHGSQKKLIGKNIRDMTAPNSLKIFQKQMEAVENPDGDFIYYSWENPTSSKISPKVSFVRRIPEWNWIVGTGAYLDTIEKEVNSIRKKIVAELMVKVLIFAIFLFLIVLYLIISLHKYNTFFLKNFSLFTHFVKQSARSNTRIDLDKIYYREFLKISKEVNRIVEDKLQTDKKIRNSEKRLLLQRKQSPLAYVGWDTNYKIDEWNPSAERIFGYTREEILGQDLDLIVPETILPEVKKMFTNFSEYNKRLRNINQNNTKDGHTITCEWYNNYLIENNGETLGIVATAHDISERINIQKEISLKNIELKKSLEEKEVLLKEVHHRVKNNMAIISSLLSLQSMDIKNEGLQTLLLSSQNRVKSMALVHELIYKSDSLKDINVLVYIEELIAALISSFGYYENQIALKIDIADIDLELDLLIPLGMLLNEIISNSFKYAFKEVDSPELTVTLREIDTQTIYIKIGDNGPGFNSKESSNKEGSIGLMLIEGLAQQIDGRLKVDTESGTNYHIYFSKNSD